MVDIRALGAQPVLEGALVRLEPVGPQHLDGLWPLYDDGADDADPTAELTREQTRSGLAKAAAREDRADWAVVRVSDGVVVGEVVLFDLDEDASSMSFRIALVGPEVFGRGYGTEATLLARDWAFGPLGLHRLALHVDADNLPARAVYRRAGFVDEGIRRDAGWRDGRWYDVHDLAIIDTDPRP